MIEPHLYVITVPYEGCGKCGVGPGASHHNSHEVRRSVGEENYMKLKDEQKLRDTLREVALEFVVIERRLHAVGLIKTAHQLNGVTKTLGWEAAELLTGTKEPGHRFFAEKGKETCRDCGRRVDASIHTLTYHCRYCRGEGLSPCTCEWGKHDE
jgi:hypothetical protein